MNPRDIMEVKVLRLDHGMEAEGGDSKGTSQVSWGFFLGDSTVPFAKMGIPK